MLIMPAFAQNSTPSVASSTADLFQLAFGRKQPEIFYPYTVALVVANKKINAIQIELNPISNEMRLSAEFIAPTLRDSVRAGQYAGIDGYIDANGFFKLDEMRSAGFVINLDLRRLLLTVDLPVAARERVLLSVAALGDGYDDLLRQASAPVSGYVNIINYHRYREGSLGSDHAQLLRAETNVNIGNWVAQYEGNYVSSTTEGDFYLNAGARVIYSQRERASHYIIGDQRLRSANWALRPTPIARLFNEPLMGLGLNKRAHLDAFSNISTTFFYDFVLNHNAEIQVFVNEELFYQVDLVAGAYRLQDLALNQGLNTIRVVLLGENGEVKAFSDSYYQSYELLRAGENELQLTTGYTYSKRYDDITALNDDPITLLYYRHGLSERYTLAAYVQHQHERQLLGSVLQVGTGLGLLNVDMAYSEDNIVGSDIAFRTELAGNPVYAPFGFYHESYQSYGFIIEYFGNNFTNATSFRPSLQWIVSPTLELGLSARSRLSAKINHRRFHDDRDSETSYSFSYSRRWQQFDVELIYEQATLFNNEEENQVRLTFTWSGHSGRTHIRTEQNLSDARTDISASHRPASNSKLSYGLNSSYENIDNASTTVDVSYQDGYTNNALEWTSNKRNGEVEDVLIGRLEGSRGSLRSFVNKTRQHKEYRVGFETAVAFVGSTFALSKVIDDSFALVVPKSGAKGHKVAFNPGSQIDWLGPAVISSLESYQPQRISIKESDALFGVDFGRRSFYLNPNYASGSLIYVGSEGNILLSATLVDANNTAIPLATGRLILQGNSAPPVLFFTNGAGLFSATGLQEGAYRLELDGGGYEPLVLNLSLEQSEHGYTNLGTLQLKAKSRVDGGR